MDISNKPQLDLIIRLSQMLLDNRCDLSPVQITHLETICTQAQSLLLNLAKNQSPDPLRKTISPLRVLVASSRSLQSNASSSLDALQFLAVQQICDTAYLLHDALEPQYFD